MLSFDTATIPSSARIYFCLVGSVAEKYDVKGWASHSYHESDNDVGGGGGGGGGYGRITPTTNRNRNRNTTVSIKAEELISRGEIRLLSKPTLAMSFDFASGGKNLPSEKGVSTERFVEVISSSGVDTIDAIEGVLFWWELDISPRSSSVPPYSTSPFRPNNTSKVNGSIVSEHFMSHVLEGEDGKLQDHWPNALCAFGKKVDVGVGGEGNKFLPVSCDFDGETTIDFRPGSSVVVVGEGNTCSGEGCEKLTKSWTLLDVVTDNEYQYNFDLMKQIAFNGVAVDYDVVATSTGWNCEPRGDNKGSRVEVRDVGFCFTGEGGGYCWGKYDGDGEFTGVRHVDDDDDCDDDDNRAKKRAKTTTTTTSPAENASQFENVWDEPTRTLQLNSTHYLAFQKGGVASILSATPNLTVIDLSDYSLLSMFILSMSNPQNLSNIHITSIESSPGKIPLLAATILQLDLNSTSSNVQVINSLVENVRATDILKSSSGEAVVHVISELYSEKISRSGSCALPQPSVWLEATLFSYKLRTLLANGVIRPSGFKPFPSRAILLAQVVRFKELWDSYGAEVGVVEGVDNGAVDEVLRGKVGGVGVRVNEYQFAEVSEVFEIGALEFEDVTNGGNGNGNGNVRRTEIECGGEGNAVVTWVKIQGEEEGRAYETRGQQWSHEGVWFLRGERGNGNGKVFVEYEGGDVNDVVSVGLCK